MKVTTDRSVKDVYKSYPKPVRERLLYIRALVLRVASEIEGLEIIEETLSWGEPSYHTRHGSTIRIAWKKERPEQYAVYFTCTSKLVPACKERYTKKFHFEGNRAIVFTLDEKVPVTELKHCIRMALTYHTIKHKLYI